MADAIKTIEEKLRQADGSIDTAAAQAELQRLQARSAELTNDELREAIQLVRILRRTNTGPAAARKKSTKVQKHEGPEPINLLDL